MGYAPRALLAGGLGLAVSFLVACGGGSGLLSADQASTLNGQLDQIQLAVNNGQCGPAADAVTTFSNAVVDLPPSVSPTLTNNLKQGASTVSVLAAHDCLTTHSTTTSTTKSSTSTSTSSSTPTTTSSSSSTTSTPTSTSTSTPTSTSSTATSSTASGTTSSTSGSGGAGLGGGTGGSGGAGAGGNGQTP